MNKSVNDIKFFSSFEALFAIGLGQLPRLGPADLVNHTHSVNFSSEPMKGRHPVFVTVEAPE